MNDRDALIERMEKVADGGLRAIDWGEATRFKDDLRALISLASPSPAQTSDREAGEWVNRGEGWEWISPAWPEDVVERASRINHPSWWRMYDGLPHHSNVFERSKIEHLANMRAALATLPPPEDERVKGLVSALTDARRRLVAIGDLFGANECTNALASYRGGA